MKKIKLYTEISKVEMADDNNVYSISQDEFPSDFSETLKDFYEGDLDLACEDGCVYETKEEALEASGSVVISGYGTYSGRKVWQLPDEIRVQLKQMLRSVEISVPEHFKIAETSKDSRDVKLEMSMACEAWLLLEDPKN